MTIMTCVAIVFLAIAVTGIFGPTLIRWLLQIAASADPQGTATIYVFVAIILLWTLISFLSGVKGLRNNKKFRVVMRVIRFVLGCISILMSALVLAHGPIATAAKAWTRLMENHSKIFGAIQIGGFIVAAGSVFFLIGNGLRSRNSADDD